MHRFARSLFFLTLLAGVLAIANAPARAQSLEQLKADINALDLASEQGMLHLIYVAQDRLDAGRSDLAIKALNSLAHVIDHAGEIDNSTADDLLLSIELSIDVLIVGPQEWWCDHDGDGYTVYGGVSYFAPSAYCSNDPGFGHDIDDSNAGIPGAGLRQWWCDYDLDTKYVYVGSSYTAPSENCVAESFDPGGCPDLDDNDPAVQCL
jgi:hypothetical protein